MESKRSNAVDEMAAWEASNPVTLVGGNRPYHLMSVLLAEHSHSRGILGFLTLCDANALRSVCKELRDEVATFRWKDMVTRINGRLDLWRICFPGAISANLSESFDLHAEDFVHLKGIRHLNVSGNIDSSMSFSDASFEHIHGIQTLVIDNCRELTDAAFAYFKDIHTLEMNGCDQDTITDAAFVYLRGIHTLGMSGCNNSSITGRSLHHLLGITSLQYTNTNLLTRTAARNILNASRRLRSSKE